MNTDRSPSSTSAEIARRLLAREAANGRDVDPATVAAALQRTCARVAGNLRDAMGDDGSTALLARALAQTEAHHPALKSVRHLNGRISLDGVGASIDAHGVVAVTAAIEALLAAVIDVLGRLIGEDMAKRLIDFDAPQSRTGGGAQSS